MLVLTCIYEKKNHNNKLFICVCVSYSARLSRYRFYNTHKKKLETFSRPVNSFCLIKIALRNVGCHPSIPLLTLCVMLHFFMRTNFYYKNTFINQIMYSYYTTFLKTKNKTGELSEINWFFFSLKCFNEFKKVTPLKFSKH